MGARVSPCDLELPDVACVLGVLESPEVGCKYGRKNRKMNAGPNDQRPDSSKKTPATLDIFASSLQKKELNKSCTSRRMREAQAEVSHMDLRKDLCCHGGATLLAVTHRAHPQAASQRQHLFELTTCVMYIAVQPHCYHLPGETSKNSKPRSGSW